MADKPALIVWGDKDPGFTEPHRRRWERTFPNHRTHILRGASHYIQEDAPEEIVAAIKAWWPGPASGGSPARQGAAPCAGRTHPRAHSRQHRRCPLP